MSRDYYSLDAAARCCGVSRSVLQRAIEQGHLRAYRLPLTRHRRWRIQRRDLEAFMRAHDIPLEWLDRPPIRPPVSRPRKERPHVRPADDPSGSNPPQPTESTQANR